MYVRLTPISFAISSAFFLATTTVWGSGGENGEGGQTLVNGNRIDAADRISLGDPGGEEISPNGKDGDSISGKVVNNASLLGATGVGLVISGGVGDAGGAALGSGGGGGGGGAGGYGGGSIFGGVSIGGAGGYLTYFSAIYAPTDSTEGGAGGGITGNIIDISGTSTLTGAAGGGGGIDNSNRGGGGAGGQGGGSIFGGISIGGAGGYSNAFATSLDSANGGAGGRIVGNTILISGTSTFTGAVGGQGGDANSRGGGGAGGHGGGSIFGGISSGGAGGFSEDPVSIYVSADGGAGGNISGNTIHISGTLTLTGANGGQGGAASSNGTGAGLNGYDGGSIFGGISTGGAGGYAAAGSVASANGGAGGSVSGNKITLSEKVTISGDVYGGVSRGGAKGTTEANGVLAAGDGGQGGMTQNNIITLIGEQISIAGSIYGGHSFNGDGLENKDPEFISFYKGNTLNVQNYKGTITSINNFENYNWLLSTDDFSSSTPIFTINNSDPAFNVLLDNTKHTVELDATGNPLYAGDQVVLIDKAQGAPKLLNSQIEQGFFTVYDADLTVKGRDLILTVTGVVDNMPDGKVHPESEAFLKGRAAQLAMVDQGADMMSDGIWSARASLRKDKANIFTVLDGGSNRYKTGSSGHIKLRDFKFAVGAAKALELQNKSAGMAGIFAEHGNGDYSSYSELGVHGEVRGDGKTRYNGVGALFHVDVADTDVSKVKSKPNIFDDKYGLYLHGIFRLGKAKVDFHSADMVNGNGVEASYNTKSRYMTAMVGAGYVLTLDEKQAVNFYGRYTFSRLNGKGVQVVDEQMSLGAVHSHRLRLGVRYGYAYSEMTTSYAGLAYERNFNGNVNGSAYGFTVKEKSLKGNTAILEAGMMVKPKGANDPFSLNLGLQGHLGDRKGITAAVKARYIF